MAPFRRKKKKESNYTQKTTVQTRPANDISLYSMFGYSPTTEATNSLYEAMRGTIPIIDAAFEKTKRLIGGFSFSCENKQAEESLNRFSKIVKVGPVSMGFENFISCYFDSLLMYGNAVGEIVLNSDGTIAGLYNSNIRDILVVPDDINPLNAKVCAKDNAGMPTTPSNPELITFTALNPKPGKLNGQSILNSLPFVSTILLKVYNAIGQNFDRIGNIRFAVTYKPGNNSMDKAYAKERAEQIAKEWSEGMAASRCGDIRDFVAVGDVDIKVIGAENQIIDCNIPAKQMIEQIIAKMSIPPFMLGLSWSTTERMSKQQADALTNELSYYRRLLNPVIMKIAIAYLRTEGYLDIPKINWDVLSFNDEILEAQTRLYNAQAKKIELENEKQDKTQNESENKNLK